MTQSAGEVAACDLWCEFFLAQSRFEFLGRKAFGPLYVYLDIGLFKSAKRPEIAHQQVQAQQVENFCESPFQPPFDPFVTYNL